MDNKITVPKSVCSDEVIDYITSRYSIHNLFSLLKT